MLRKSPVAQRKKDGFKGQKAIVLPGKIVQSCEDSPLISNLFITDIGFYPKAKFHYRKRSVGISQHILIYCVDGKGWVQLDGQEYDVKSGQYFVVPAEMVHQYGSDEDAPWSIYWLHFKGRLANDYTSQLTRNKTKFVASVNFSEERTRLFDSMYATLENGYSADNLGYINMCLWYFLSSFCYDDIFHVPSGNAEKDAIDLSIEFMQQNIEHTLSLRELAAEAHISPSHYAALFKKKTGYPPLEYFNHIKVQKACQYLHFTNLQIKEIAYKVGICDPYYFSRFFSNIMGVSPLEYRNRKH
ncbi:AraC family transcriptional regulator [Flavisolibacter ginsenosidimutans]|uniref:AraC family transcriptional regulator n=1 Tax=Flavisolibacter ginsenosidimutans TaxID=661481 RepID=A0A5B8UI14_9BACT|nr:AraC family transcriptional regulator [Flavisolibacter ginsenosidimutans]QEC56301.1 AraC family transcriptional regulator [Flavisolibacter ginsenosidimutans]